MHRNFLFFTNDGYCELPLKVEIPSHPNSADSTESESVENSQILGISKGRNIHDAWNNLIYENGHLNKFDLKDIYYIELGKTAEIRKF